MKEYVFLPAEGFKTFSKRNLQERLHVEGIVHVCRLKLNTVLQRDCV